VALEIAGITENLVVVIYKWRISKAPGGTDTTCYGLTTISKTLPKKRLRTCGLGMLDWIYKWRRPTDKFNSDFQFCGDVSFFAHYLLTYTVMEHETLAIYATCRKMLCIKMCVTWGSCHR
jgi:hypothetical protein